MRYMILILRVDPTSTHVLDEMGARAASIGGSCLCALYPVMDSTPWSEHFAAAMELYGAHRRGLRSTMLVVCTDG